MPAVADTSSEQGCGAIDQGNRINMAACSAELRPKSGHPLPCASIRRTSMEVSHPCRRLPMQDSTPRRVAECVTPPLSRLISRASLSSTRAASWIGRRHGSQGRSPTASRRRTFVGHDWSHRSALTAVHYCRTGTRASAVELYICPPARTGYCWF